jgi:hypothetical protein
VKKIWLNTAFLIYSFVALQPPINDPFRFALVVCCFFVAIFFDGKETAWTRRRFALLGLLTLQLTLIWSISISKTEEGNNVFIIKDVTQNPYLTGLPREVYDIFKSEFQTTHPDSEHCSEGQWGCWARYDAPAELFAKSSDGFWQNPKFSRKIHQLKYSTQSNSRMGIVNQSNDLNFVDDFSDIRREGIPRFHVFEFPKSMIGGRLQHTGLLIWDHHGDLTPLFSDQPITTVLNSDHIESQLYVYADSRIGPVNLNLIPPLSESMLVWSLRVLQLLSIGCFVGCFYRFQISDFWREGVLILCAATFIVTVYPDLVVGNPIFFGGDDGLVHSTKGFKIAEA